MSKEKQEELLLKLVTMVQELGWDIILVTDTDGNVPGAVIGQADFVEGAKNHMINEGDTEVSSIDEYDLSSSKKKVTH
jgi:hypothetical protein